MKLVGFLKVNFFLYVLFLVFSCSTSNEVASNKLFQKRKYKKGWHMNSSPNYANRNSRSKNIESDSTSIAQVSDSNSTQYNHSESIYNSTETKKQIAFYTSKSKEKKEGNQKTKTGNINFIFSGIPTTANYQNETENHIQIQEGAKLDLFDPWLSEKAVVVILALLSLLVLIFTGITPLAVWISVGPGPALDLNLRIYVAFLFCALIFAMAMVYLVAYSAAGVATSAVLIAIVFGILMLISGTVAFFHALVSIIKGF